MRATCIRLQADNSKPNVHTLNVVCSRILELTKRAGFITEAQVLGETSLKIGMHMSSFRINTTKLGHNARIDRWTKSPKGYKRTNVPTWEQRVEFNGIVNKVFNDLKLKANIVSGYYTVRSKEYGARCSWPEGGDRSGNGYSGDASVEIIPESEARESLNSDKLEADHKAATRDARLASARESRAKRKAFLAAKKVLLSGLPEYLGNSGRNPRKFKNGDALTHAQFAKLLSKLSAREVRAVNNATMTRTAMGF